MMKPEQLESLYADWQRKLETQYPNVIDRMRELAHRCANEAYWHRQRQTFNEWQSWQERVKETFETTVKLLETKPIDRLSPEWYALLRTAQDDWTVKKTREEEEQTHRIHFQMTFDSTELYCLLAKHRPDLLAVYGVAPRMDESYTPRDRAERCNAIFAILMSSADQTKSKKSPVCYHGNRSYALDGKTPVTVSVEEDNILQAFLESKAALDTKALEKHVANVSRVMNKLQKKFPRAVHKGKSKGSGYFIEVRKA